MWVRNISSTPSSEAQEQLLVHGPNFAVVPWCPSTGEYITAVEQACQKFKQDEAEDDRDEYMKKAEDLLSQPTYKTIPADPTTKYKN